MSQKPKYSVSERKFFLRVFDVLVVIFSVFVFANSFNLHYFKSLDSNLMLWFITLGVYILFFGQVFELHNLKVSSSRYLSIRSIGLTALLVTVFYIFTPIISPELPENRLQIFYLFLLVFIPMTLWRFLYISFVTLPKYHKYILIIGNKSKITDLVQLIKDKVSDNKIVGYISDGEIDDLNDSLLLDYKTIDIKNVVDKYSITDIVVARSEISANESIHKQLIYLFEDGIPIIGARKYIEKITAHFPDLNFDDAFYDYLNFSKSHESNLYLVTIRAFDIFISLIGILFFSIILPFVLLGNLIGNRGSLFYFQERVGKKGENFNILKLRTMVQNAERDGAVWAEKNDSRITTFGKFLRKSRFDEIPQFINILRGEMSLIGPRPERPEFVTELEEKIPYYAIRHVVKPGLTGWAQVMYPYASTLEEQKVKLRYDLFYIKERGLFLDFKILIKTISTVLFFRGN